VDQPTNLLKCIRHKYDAHRMKVSIQLDISTHSWTSALIENLDNIYPDVGDFKDIPYGKVIEPKFCRLLLAIVLREFTIFLGALKIPIHKCFTLLQGHKSPRHITEWKMLFFSSIRQFFQKLAFCQISSTSPQAFHVSPLPVQNQEPTPPS
jgi:hypothetical protein